MDYNEKFCEQQHKEINGKLDVHDKRLNRHGEQIDALEKSDAAKTQQIDHLTEAIKSQTRAIWGLVCTVLATLGGFFIWYIQTL